MVVDMSVVPANDLNPADGIHPIDAGYDVMAQVWFSGMEKAGLQGWIKTPVDGTLQSGGSAKQKCNLGTWSQCSQWMDWFWISIGFDFFLIHGLSIIQWISMDILCGVFLRIASR
jgi:hypothetical protein